MIFLTHGICKMANMYGNKYVRAITILSFFLYKTESLSHRRIEIIVYFSARSPFVPHVPRCCCCCCVIVIYTHAHTGHMHHAGTKSINRRRRRILFNQLSNLSQNIER